MHFRLFRSFIHNDELHIFIVNSKQYILNEVLYSKIYIVLVQVKILF